MAALEIFSTLSPLKVHIKKSSDRLEKGKQKKGEREKMPKINPEKRNVKP